MESRYSKSNIDNSTRRRILAAAEPEVSISEEVLEAASTVISLSSYLVVDAMPEERAVNRVSKRVKISMLRIKFHLRMLIMALPEESRSKLPVLDPKAGGSDIRWSV